jgi:outer membrane protein assembly factor BamA
MEIMKLLLRFLFLHIALVISVLHLSGQQVSNIPVDSIAPDTLSKFDKFNKKAEALFQVLPFPMVTYSTETGTVFGLVKYNMVNLVKGDTISSASSFSELISFSTEGQFKVVVGANLYLYEDRIILRGGANYIKFPEYILGVGNEVSRDNIEKLTTKSFAFDNAFLFSPVKSRDLYFGIVQDYVNYLDIEADSNSFLFVNKYPGYDGGVNSGFGFGIAYDTRDLKQNAMKGTYISSTYEIFGSYVGGDFEYGSFELDIRKFFNPWLKHVIALQAYTIGNFGAVPYFSLGKLGGSNNMRGYYLGAIRDKVMAFAQVEYRMPVWKIFGVVAFAGAGRVAEKYNGMHFDGLWYSGGFGLRVMVDSKHKANIRFDFGYGEKGSRTLAIGFTEAF